MAAEPTEEEMFFIAADLTLYSNPLNKALGRASIKQEAPAQQKKDEKKEEDAKKDTSKAEEEEEEFIASDMNKYDSPLADLDTKYNEKHEVHQKAQESHLQKDNE